MSTLPSRTLAGGGSGRIVSLDIMRGLVMVIMALDHTRDFFSNLRFEPENLARTYYALFFTRWITHFCAPLFFFWRGPVFFYILHLYLIHSLALVVALLSHQPVGWLLNGGFIFGAPDGWGYGLPFVYLVWITVVVVLYVPCRWYEGVKQRRKDWWLSYI